MNKLNHVAFIMDGNGRWGEKKGKGRKKAVSTRKKRQELSISATKTIKKEDVEIVVKFN